MDQCIFLILSMIKSSIHSNQPEGKCKYVKCKTKSSKKPEIYSEPTPDVNIVTGTAVMIHVGCVCASDWLQRQNVLQWNKYEDRTIIIATKILVSSSLTVQVHR